MNINSDQHITLSPSTSRSQPDVRPLAVFDFDGTLIKGDSFLPFLITYAWRRRRFRPIFILPFYLALYVCRILSDRDAKERLIGVFFRQEPIAKISTHSERFCSEWVQRRFGVNVLRKLREHQAAGHRVMLVSASPDLYIPQVAVFLGITETVCTRVSIEDGYCKGTLAGPNCKGLNKVTLIQEYLGITTSPDPSYGYGDSRSDLPVLTWVRRGFLCRRSRLDLLPVPFDIGGETIAGGHRAEFHSCHIDQGRYEES